MDKLVMVEEWVAAEEPRMVCHHVEEESCYTVMKTKYVPRKVSRVCESRSIIPFRGVMIPALDPDPESNFQLLNNSGSQFAFSKKRNLNTYTG